MPQQPTVRTNDPTRYAILLTLNGETARLPGFSARKTREALLDALRDAREHVSACLGTDYWQAVPGPARSLVIELVPPGVSPLLYSEHDCRAVGHVRFGDTERQTRAAIQKSYEKVTGRPAT